MAIQLTKTVTESDAGQGTETTQESEGTSTRTDTKTQGASTDTVTENTGSTSTSKEQKTLQSFQISFSLEIQNRNPVDPDFTDDC
jgi:hypothetical protein